MLNIFFTYYKIMSSKQFTSLQNKSFGYSFHFTSITILSKPIFGWEVAFLLRSKTHIALPKVLRSGSDKGHKFEGQNRENK